VDGRICTADIKTAHFSFRIINTKYAPNELKARIVFIKETLPSYLSLSIKNIVRADLNCAENFKLATAGHISNTDTLIGFSDLHTITTSFTLIDSFR